MKRNMPIGAIIIGAIWAGVSMTCFAEPVLIIMRFMASHEITVENIDPTYHVNLHIPAEGVGGHYVVQVITNLESEIWHSIESGTITGETFSTGTQIITRFELESRAVRGRVMFGDTPVPNYPIWIGWGFADHEVFMRSYSDGAGNYSFANIPGTGLTEISFGADDTEAYDGTFRNQWIGDNLIILDINLRAPD